MSKERLEEIKRKFDLDRIRRFVDTKLISPQDLIYLIEQAERVSKQETRINNLTFDLAVSRVQNKRYREALEFYANKENWKKLIIDNNTMYLGKMNVEQDYGEKARKALEGESE